MKFIDLKTNLIVCTMVFCLILACKKNSNELSYCKTFPVDTIVYEALKLKSTSNFSNSLNFSEQVKKPIIIAFYSYGNQNPIASVQKSGLRNLVNKKITKLIDRRYILVTLPVDNMDKIVDKSKKIDILEQFFDNFSPELKSEAFHPHKIRSQGNFNQVLQLALCRSNTNVSFAILNKGTVNCLELETNIEEQKNSLYQELVRVSKYEENKTR